MAMRSKAGYEVELTSILSAWICSSVIRWRIVFCQIGTDFICVHWLCKAL